MAAIGDHYNTTKTNGAPTADEQNVCEIREDDVNEVRYFKPHINIHSCIYSRVSTNCSIYVDTWSWSWESVCF